MTSRSYGVCPAQLDGITHDGRPFYFRSRHGVWTLHVGECGWVPNICCWPEYGNDQLVAHGDAPVEDPDAIDELVTQHLGAGWRHVTREETQFPACCTECHEVFTSDASTICVNCLASMLRGDQ